jgi:hypothetical protein
MKPDNEDCGKTKAKPFLKNGLSGPLCFPDKPKTFSHEA